MSTVPLRTGFKIQPGTAYVHDQSSLYRRMFKSLGLGTSSALFHFWSALQSNARRRNSDQGEFVPPEDLPNASTEQDDLHRGFEVEMIEEDPDQEIHPCFLDCGKLILGDEQIAAYDNDGYNVWIAVREEACIVVYNIRDLIAVYLCDELRLQFAKAVAVPVGAKTTMQAAQAGTQSALAALLGLGYIITPGKHLEEVYISITGRNGLTASLPVQHMTGLVGTLMKSDPSRLANPEWVFEQIQKQDMLLRNTPND